MMKKRNTILSRIFRRSSKSSLNESDNTMLTREKKIEIGAKDFAKRFEAVMRELSNG